MKKTEPLVLVSVLNWNNETDTVRCLESLDSLTYRNFRTVLLDNASVDGSPGMIQSKFPGLQIIRSGRNLGYAGGHKKIYETCMEKDCDALWILNNDTRVKPGALTRLVEAMEAFPEAVMGSLVLDPEGRVKFGGGYEMKDGTPDIQGGWNIHEGKAYDQVAGDIRTREVSDVNGSSLLIPAGVIQSGGFLPTRLFLYGEETMYCFRLRKEHGIRSVLVAGSQVVHKGSASWSTPVLENLALYYRKRNSLIFRKQYLGYRNRKLARYILSPGWLARFIGKSLWWAGRPERKAGDRYYMQQLAVFHAFLNRAGRTIDPGRLFTK